jgi:hypothetical protein
MTPSSTKQETGSVADKLIAQAEEAERRALEIEGDSDNPLRVAAANKYWDRAEVLRARAGAGQ